MRPFFIINLLVVVASAFQAPTAPAFHLTLMRESKAAEQQVAETSDVEKFLSKKYPEFYRLFSKNKEVVRAVKGSDGSGCTIFAPNSSAFAALEDKKRRQLEDPRNLETVEKMGAYHVVISEAIPWNRLFQEDWTVPPKDGKPALSIGGVKTLGGEVKVGRSKSGGLFLGLGAKEDGGVVVGPDAKILQSFNVGDCIVHEVDALVSPPILWRYADQLRIPGL